MQAALSMVMGKAKLFGLAAGVMGVTYKGLRYVSAGPRAEAAAAALQTLPGCTDMTLVFQEDVLDPLTALYSVVDVNPTPAAHDAFVALVHSVNDFVADYLTLHELAHGEAYGWDPTLFDAHVDNVEASMAYLFRAAGVRTRKVGVAEEVEAGGAMVLGLPVDTNWRHAAMNLQEFVTTSAANAQLTLSSNLLLGSDARLKALEREAGLPEGGGGNSMPGSGLRASGIRLPQEILCMSSEEVVAAARRHATLTRGSRAAAK